MIRKTEKKHESQVRVEIDDLLLKTRQYKFDDSLNS